MDRTQTILNRIRKIRELNGGRDSEIDKTLHEIEQSILKQIEAAMDGENLFEKIQEAGGAIEEAERIYGVRKQEYDNIFKSKDEFDLDLYCEMQINIEKVIVKSLKAEKMNVIEHLKLFLQRKRKLKELYKIQANLNEAFSMDSKILDSLEASVASLISRHIPKEVQREVWRRDEGRCVRCGSRLNLEFDHIIPISKGGSNTARNVQLLCEKCNRDKRDYI